MDDCWRTVLDHLDGDIGSLASLLQVSRYHFYLVAPYLYGVTLFSDKQPDYRRSWSQWRRSRLAYTLFLSSGFLFPVPDTTILDEDDEPRQVYQTKWGHITQPGQWGDQDISLPLTINYYSLLKKMPSFIFSNLDWVITSVTTTTRQPISLDSKCTTVSCRGPPTTAQFAAFHAEVMAEFSIYSRDLPLLIPEVERFSCLRAIHFLGGESVHDIEEYERSIVEFIKLHNAAYPGLLDEFATPYLRDNVEGQGLAIHFTQPGDYSSINTDSDVGGAIDLKYSKACHTRYGISTAAFRELDQLLSTCRNLERIRIVSNEESSTAWPSLFSWAARERNQERREGGASEDVTSNDAVISLVRVRELDLSGVSILALLDAMRGFDATLEKITYVGFHAQGVYWDWTMSRLVELKLNDCEFDFRSLGYCPNLKVLYLSDTIPVVVASAATLAPLSLSSTDGVSSGAVDLWRVPVKVEQLVVSGVGYNYLDFASLSALNRLKYMRFCYSESVDLVSAKRAIETDTSAWDLSNLEELSIEGHCVDHWQLRLVQCSPNIRAFDVPVRYSMGFLRHSSVLEFQSYLEQRQYPSRLEILELYSCQMTETSSRVLLSLAESTTLMPRLRTVTVHGSVQFYPDLEPQLLNIMKRTSMKHLMIRHGNRTFIRANMIRVPKDMTVSSFPIQSSLNYPELSPYCVLCTLENTAGLYRLAPT